MFFKAKLHEGSKQSIDITNFFKKLFLAQKSVVLARLSAFLKLFEGFACEQKIYILID